MYCVNILMVEDNLPFRTTCMLDNKGYVLLGGVNLLYTLCLKMGVYFTYWCGQRYRNYKYMQLLDSDEGDKCVWQQPLFWSANCYFWSEIALWFQTWSLKRGMKLTGLKLIWEKVFLSLAGALSKLAPSCVKWFTVVFSEKKFPFVVKRNWMLCWGHCHSTVFGM